MRYNFNDYYPFRAHYWNGLVIKNTFSPIYYPNTLNLPCGITYY